MIKIKGKYYLDSDTMNWLIRKKGINKGEECFPVQAYFNNLPEACNYFMDNYCRSSSSMDDLHERIKEARDVLLKAIQKVKLNGRLTTEGEKCDVS